MITKACRSGPRFLKKLHQILRQDTKTYKTVLWRLPRIKYRRVQRSYSCARNLKDMAKGLEPTAVFCMSPHQEVKGSVIEDGGGDREVNGLALQAKKSALAGQKADAER